MMNVFRRKKSRPVSWVPKGDSGEIPGIADPVRSLSVHFTSAEEPPDNWAKIESENKIATLPKGSGRLPAPALHTISKSNSTSQQPVHVSREHGFAASADKTFQEEGSSEDELSVDKYKYPKIEFTSFKTDNVKRSSKPSEQNESSVPAKNDVLKLEDSLQSTILPTFIHAESPPAIKRNTGVVPVAVVSPTQSIVLKAEEDHPSKLISKSLSLVFDNPDDQDLCFNENKSELAPRRSRPLPPRRSTSLHGMFGASDNGYEISSLHSESTYDSDCSSITGIDNQFSYDVYHAADTSFHEDEQAQMNYNELHNDIDMTTSSLHERSIENNNVENNDCHQDKKVIDSCGNPSEMVSGLTHSTSHEEKHTECEHSECDNAITMITSINDHVIGHEICDDSDKKIDAIEDDTPNFLKQSKCDGQNGLHDCYISEVITSKEEENDIEGESIFNMVEDDHDIPADSSDDVMTLENSCALPACGSEKENSFLSETDSKENNSEIGLTATSTAIEGNVCEALDTLYSGKELDTNLTSSDENTKITSFNENINKENKLQTLCKKPTLSPKPKLAPKPAISTLKSRDISAIFSNRTAQLRMKKESGCSQNQNDPSASKHSSFTRNDYSSKVDSPKENTNKCKSLSFSSESNNEDVSPQCKDPIMKNNKLIPKNVDKPQVPSKPVMQNYKISSNDSPINTRHLDQSALHVKEKCDSPESTDIGYSSNNLLKFCLEPLSCHIKRTEHAETTRLNTVKESNCSELLSDTVDKSTEKMHAVEGIAHPDLESGGYSSLTDSGIDTPEPNFESPCQNLKVKTNDSDMSPTSSTNPLPSDFDYPTPPPRKNKINKSFKSGVFTSDSRDYFPNDQSDYNTVCNDVDEAVKNETIVTENKVVYNFEGPYISLISVDNHCIVENKCINEINNEDTEMEDINREVPKLDLVGAGIISDDDTDNELRHLQDEDTYDSDTATDFDNIMEPKAHIPSPFQDINERQVSYVIDNKVHYESGRNSRLGYYNNNGRQSRCGDQNDKIEINSEIGNSHQCNYQEIQQTPRFEYNDVLPTPRLDPVEFADIDDISEGICPEPPYMYVDSTSETMDMILRTIPPPPPSDMFKLDLVGASDLPETYRSDGSSEKMKISKVKQPLVYSSELDKNVSHPRSAAYKCVAHSSPTDKRNTEDHSTKFMRALKANQDILSLDNILVEDDYIPETSLDSSPEDEASKMPWQVCLSRSWQPQQNNLKRQDSSSSSLTSEESVIVKPLRTNAVKKQRGTGSLHYNLAAIRPTNSSADQKQLNHNKPRTTTKQANLLSAGRLSASMESFQPEVPLESRQHHQQRRRRHSSVSDISAITDMLSVTSSVYLQQDIPLEKWSNSQVLQWLDAVGLEQFSERFLAYKVTGIDLANISLQLLDDINITNIEERQVLLHQLTLLQQNQASSGHASPKLKSPKSKMKRYTSIKSQNTSSSIDANGSIASKMEQLTSLEFQMADIEASLLTPVFPSEQPTSWACPVPAESVPEKQSIFTHSNQDKDLCHTQPKRQFRPRPPSDTSSLTKQELLGRYLDDQTKGQHAAISSPSFQRISSPNIEKVSLNSHSLHNGSSHSDQQLELLREIALLRDTVTEKDELVQTLKSELDSLHQKSNKNINLEHEIEKGKAEKNNLQKRHQQEMEHLQNEISHLRKQIIDKDPQIRVNYLEEELAAVHDELAQEEMKLADLQLINHSSPQQSQQLEQEKQLTNSCVLSLRTRLQQLTEQLDYAKLQAKLPQSLYKLLGEEGQHPLVTCELPLVGGSYGLMLARDAQLRVFVKSSSDPMLSPGDSILEVNGVKIPGLNDQELGKVLKDAKQHNKNLKLVVERESLSNTVVTNEEFEIFKEDLSLALHELETAQNDKKSLHSEVERLRQAKEELRHDNEQLKVEVVDVRKKLEQVDSEWQQLRDMLRKQQQSTGPSDHLLEMLEQMARDSSHRRTYYNKRSTKPKSHHKYEGLEWLHKLVSAEDLNEVLEYGEFEEHAPMWESMKGASKEEILQALKDSTLEHKQQKLYLDHLVNLVIENNPDLLDTVDHRLGLDADAISIRSQTEEHC